jgi:hypothetical protein
MEKSFFRERTPSEIKKLGLNKVQSMQNLMDIIENTDLNQGIQLDFKIKPEEWEDSNDWLKHGNFLLLKTPDTIEESIKKKKTPLYGRARACDNLKLGTDALGFIYRPVVGEDRIPRAHMFYELLEGTKLLSYIQKMFPKEYIETGEQFRIYDNAKAVETQGAHAFIRLPSRHKNEQRYEIHPQHIPVVNNDWKTAIAKSYTTHYSHAPRNTVFPNIRYPTKNDLLGEEVRFLTAHDIAAYFVITNYYKKIKKNSVPWDVGLFAKPSKLAAKIHALCDHCILINDEEKLRKLHVTERSNLIANSIAVFGHDNILYWNPEKDPKFTEYPWNPC